MDNRRGGRTGNAAIAVRKQLSVGMCVRGESVVSGAEWERRGWLGRAVAGRAGKASAEAEGREGRGRACHQQSSRRPSELCGPEEGAKKR